MFMDLQCYTSCALIALCANVEATWRRQVWQQLPRLPTPARSRLVPKAQVSACQCGALLHPVALADLENDTEVEATRARLSTQIAALVEEYGAGGAGAVVLTASKAYPLPTSQPSD